MNLRGMIPALLVMTTLALADEQAPLLQKSAAQTSPLSEDQALRIATDGYVFGYPEVLMEITEKVTTNTRAPSQFKAPINQFIHLRKFPNAKFRDVVSPNVDTLYSSAWLDLSNEPMLLHLPDSHDRYYLFPMLDAWTNVFASPGKRTTGTHAGDFAIVGPDFKGTLPAGVQKIQAPTNRVWIIGRTYCDGTPSDYKAVHAFQDGITLKPLSAFGKKYVAAKGKIDPTVEMNVPSPHQVFKMDAQSFFNSLAMSMKRNPASADDAAMIANLAKIGVIPGQPFDLSKLDPATTRGVNRAVEEAQNKIKATGEKIQPVNGWMYLLSLGQYGTDYLLRAHVGLVGLGANSAKDAVYPMAEIDGQNQKLNGSNRYVLHFNKDELPPVNAFWSVTMYDSDRFLVNNPLNKYAVRSADKLAFNADGSLDIYVQKDSPGAGKESNWLPSAANDFNVVLRMYWPKEPVLNDQWKPAPIQRVETKLGVASQAPQTGG